MKLLSTFALVLIGLLAVTIIGVSLPYVIIWPMLLLEYFGYNKIIQGIGYLIWFAIMVAIAWEMFYKNRV